ncbi:helix-turn-helix domain-containing protein [Ornithinimicrobium sp. INDO-MA30-4]|uniref:helix-turn-helix domain-containing protein n=1 Tax=Ornithinimicrobium sp. INDO-MA30-4 TaxID=2908651 RepID=UPI001F458C9C|nr:helix-turn-helix domain-containing protein [Ornithinimicrobium sp. INDO-MA30-4]UJH70441.1 helix-turn-helix domain-containing protein [Ornithinimicrobium sp. INDO-MA30-4]
MVALASVTLNTSVVRSVPAARSRQTKTVKRRLTNSDHARMVELYEAGDNAQSVAEQVGVAKSTVLRTLKARGVQVRPRGLHYQTALPRITERVALWHEPDPRQSEVSA